jgi:hypothetical protein
MIETIAGATRTKPPEQGPPEQGPPQDLTTAQLEAEICTLAGHIAAATCRFLELILDFDDRGGWAAWDMRSCAAWLSWKCSLSPKTARDQLRTARALKDLPVLHAEFAAGRFSYSKVRAVARIATPETEADLVDMCTLMTAAQADRLCAAVGSRIPRDEDESGLPGGPRTALRWRFDEDTGELSMTVQLPPADGAVVLQALRAALGDLDHPHDQAADLAGEQRPDEFKVPASDLAEALIEVAGGYLRGKIATADNADVYQVQVHVVPQMLDREPVPAGTGEMDRGVPAGTPGVDHPCRPGRCHLEDGPAISPADAQRIACSATLSAMLHDPGDGSVLDAGRRSRSATAAIRRAVRERDGARCCFPGCDSRRTDLHHIVWWRNGGTTTLDNLLPACKRHHTLIHANGYIICRLGPGQYSFTDPASSRVIVPLGTLPEAEGPITGTHDADITDDTIQQALGDRLDLHFAVWVALQNGRDPENEQYLHQRHETTLAA